MSATLITGIFRVVALVEALSLLANFFPDSEGLAGFQSRGIGIVCVHLFPERLVALLE